MWFVDRSRYLEGVEHCQMARYYEYHSGPYGYGIKRKEGSVPLSTGTYTDQALSDVLRNAQLAQQAGTEIGDYHNDLFRKIIGKAVADYRAEVERRGFLAEQNISNVMHTVEEQSALIEGLAWAWILGQLPGLLNDHEIVCIQQEESYVIPGTCTCHLATHSSAFADIYYDYNEHHKECNGICIISRPDFVTRRQGIIQHDFKTHGYKVDERFVEKHRDSVQMAIQSLGLEARLGEPVKQYYIHALVKGGRDIFSKKGQNKEGLPKSQYSDLCYAKTMSPNPPINDKTIVDYKGFWYDKTPSWKVELSDKPADYRHMEYWVSLMPKEVLYAQTALCGPYERPDHMINAAVQHVLGEERRWINALWKIHNGEDLNFHVSRSYDCLKYGEEYRCPFYTICFKGAGWEDPIGSGKYVHRLPHHAAEVEQMTARGIPVPESE